MDNDVPAIAATFAGSAPKLDGKVGDQVWRRARRAVDFQLVGSRGPATQPTEVRVCYDRTNLYILFECFEDDMDGIIANYTADHEPVWQDDSVEVFICPYGVAGASRCHQFVVNAAGAKACLRSGWVRSDETWRAATLRLHDRWIAEIAIPLRTLAPLGRNEDCWRINFCRNEHPHGEQSSWSAVPKWYATYSRFGRLLPGPGPYRFNTFRGELVRLPAPESARAGIEPVKVPVRDVEPAGFIIPEPQEIHNRLSKGVFRIGFDTVIVVNDAADEVDMWAAEDLAARIEDVTGRRLSIVRASGVSRSAEAAVNMIVIGESTCNSVLRGICERDEVRMLRTKSDGGAYVLDVLPARIALVGQSPVDTYYGVQTLKQLIRVERDGSAHVPAMAIRDFPKFAFRGVHLLASKDALTWIGKLIDRVFAPLKVNHIILQTDKIAWASHPEVTDPNNSMPREDVKQLIEIARRHHITVTPLVQSPGHLEWAFRGGKNLEFAEDPEHPYCYCMSNPKSYEFIFSIMDEAIELFGHPEYFHAGRDEFDMSGRVPHDDQCKAVGKERLYYQDTLKVYEHLRENGCKMMMWGDILSKPGFCEMIDELPRDILINDWCYGPAETYPTVEFFQAHGFPVLGCTWYDPRNISTFSGYAARRGITGMLQTTWTGFKTEEETLRDHADQVYAYILAAAWAWNPVRPAVDSIPYRPRMVFEAMWRGQGRYSGAEFSIVSLAPHYNVSRADSGRSIGWLGIGRGNDLRGLLGGLVSVGGVPYLIAPAKLDEPSAVLLGGEGVADGFPRRVDGIEVGAAVRSLHFLHGCAYPADEGALVGSYLVRYKDGGVEEIPLVYEKSIYTWDDQSSGMSYGFAWRGRGQDGRAVGVCDLHWRNPRPGAKIAFIDFVAGRTQASPFLLAVTIEK